MKILLHLLLGLVLTMSAIGQTINLRMSVKIILNPGGLRCLRDPLILFATKKRTGDWKRMR